MNERDSGRAPLAPLSDFAAPTLEDWRRMAREELGLAAGEAPEPRLAQPADGGRRPALALPDAGVPRAALVRDVAPRDLETAPSWSLVVPFAERDEASLAERVREAVEGGARGLWFDAAPVEASGWERVLRPVELATAAFHLPPGQAGQRAFAALGAYARSVGLEPRDLTVVLGADPAARRAVEGEAAAPEALREELVDQVRAALAVGERVRAFTVDARPYQDAGAGGAWELGAAVGALVEALVTLERSGIAAPTVVDRFALRFAVGGELLEEVAKLRAARVLIPRVLAALGAAPSRPIWIHADTSLVAFSLRDPWTNALRAGAASVAAALGGADAITTRAHDGLDAQPSAEGRRLARNVSLILSEEGRLGRVLDPLAGSYAVEAATDRLARAGWAAFQELEAGGGLLAGLADGSFAQRLATEAAARAERVRTGELRRLGVNRFAPAAGSDDLAQDASPATPPGALPRLRDAEPFEALVRRADRLAAAGRRPRALVAALGSPAEVRARAAFCEEFYALGGFDVATVERPRADGPAEVTDAIVTERADIVCLALPEDRVATLVPPFARALAGTASALHVAVAPGRLEAELVAAGVVGFVHRGADAVRLLEAALARAGEGSEEAAR